jgi:hypothetical protein
MLHAIFLKEIEEISTALQFELAALDKEQNKIKQLDLSRKSTSKAIKKLEEFLVLRNEFNTDPAALVNFNRDLAPPFYAKFIFLSKVLAFECLKIDTDSRECEQLCELEHAGIRRFFQQHTEFRRYHLSGATDHDTFYYQNFANNSIYLDDLVVGISPTVNRGCLLVAYMQAFETYRSYLATAGCHHRTEMTIDPDLKWMGSQSDLSEVCIALEGHINKGSRPATIKEITQTFGSLFHVNLSNSFQLDNKRRNRLDDGPNFLEKLAAESNKRKNKLIENQKSRKRRD